MIPSSESFALEARFNSLDVEDESCVEEEDEINFI